MKPTIIVGQIYKSNRYGFFEIIKYNSAKDVLVRFVETSSIERTHAHCIRDGHVTDRALFDKAIDDRRAIKDKEKQENQKIRGIARAQREIEKIEENEKRKKERIAKRFKPSVFGVGYLGIGKYKAYITSCEPTRAYRAWRSMMQRCYRVMPNGERSHKSYAGVTVCQEWHNFQVFAKWYYSNYPKGIKPGVYQIDKDKISNGNKVYSPDLCEFITQNENLRLREYQ